MCAEQHYNTQYDTTQHTLQHYPTAANREIKNNIITNNINNN